jgi:hypothetical protein
MIRMTLWNYTNLTDSATGEIGTAAGSHRTTEPSEEGPATMKLTPTAQVSVAE